MGGLGHNSILMGFVASSKYSIISKGEIVIVLSEVLRDFAFSTGSVVFHWFYDFCYLL